MKKTLLFILFIFCLSVNMIHAQGIVNSGAYLVMSAGSNIYIDGGASGSYTSTGSSFIKATGGLATLSIEGNFTNNSSTTAIDGVPYSLIKLVGATQSINGSASSTLGGIECAGTGAKTISTKQNISKITLNGQNLTLSDSVNLRGVLTLTSGALTTGGKLTLISTGDSTASIAQITSGTISGDIIAQRFIPGGSGKRKWRFLSSPVNVSGSITLAQFKDDIFVTAPSEAGGGFDVNPFAKNSSIRTYVESVAGTINNGWTDPTNITNTISTAQGVEVFVRGSRALANPYLNWTVPDNVVIDYIGAANTGTINRSLTYTNNSQINADGFNLVGNPYPCTIDWQAASGWTRTNMQNFIWVYDPVLGTYGTISSSGTKTGNLNITRYIASGQAFFVRATSSGASLQFTETVKVLQTPFNFYKGSEPQNLLPLLGMSLTYVEDQNLTDRCLVEFNPEGTNIGKDDFDAVKFFNDKINIYTISDDAVPLAINSMKSPLVKDTLRLAVWHYDSTNVKVGMHQLRFDSLSSLDLSINLYLIDEYASTITNIRNQNYYDFNIEENASSYGNNRFKIVFDLNTGINTDEAFNQSLNIYPNPSQGELFIRLLNQELKNTNAFVSIHDLVGQEVLQLENFILDNTQKIDIFAIPQGVYIITIKADGKTSHKKFIKE